MSLFAGIENNISINDYKSIFVSVKNNNENNNVIPTILDINNDKEIKVNFITDF